ncbi:MAG: aquaporin [Porphyromonadaceae bacterium CG2_30_38_12]|nr:MAG: aquaporin [Porphyromonadaceae bacterium CG2_30_38_12]
MLKYKNEFLGELLGTFILVIFGCGSVAVSVLFKGYQSILEIALVWGIGVTLAIYLTRHICCAHLNPAVSIAMVITKRMSVHRLPTYIIAQVLGAFIAGLAIYILFSSTINSFELTQNIIRGSEESAKVAKMFGEFYNIGGHGIGMPLAVAAEAFGTFILLFMIFALTEGCNVGKPSNDIAPVLIGLTVSSIICLIAPLTQAGLNPARDFGPRMVAWMFGWGNAAFPDQQGGFFLVYMLAPIVGGILAALFFTKIIEPAMKNSTTNGGCCDNDTCDIFKKK